MLRARWLLTLTLVEMNGWVDLFMAVDEFKAYIESEHKNVLGLVTNLGLVKK